MPGLVSSTFLLIVAATLAVFTAVGAVVPVLPRYVEGPLGGGAVAIGFVVGAFFMATLLARPFAGRLGDERGRKLVIVGGAAVMAAAIAAFPLASNIVLLAVLRFIQGAGEAAFYVGAATAVTDLVPASRRGQAVSYFSGALYAGIALGPLVGEWMLGDGSYGRVWALAAALGAAGAVLSLWLREAPRVAATGARARLVHPAALMPGSAFGLGTFGYAAFAAFMPLYAPSLGLEGSAPVFGVYAGITLAGRLFGARIPDRLGPSTTARAGLVTMAVGMAILGVWHAVPGLWAGTVVFALGNAFMFPAVLSLALDAAPDSERASVVGTVVAFFDLGQGAGALLLGPLVAVSGYTGPFVAGALAAIAGLGLLSAHLRRAQLELAPS
ncbi:MAG TPA: MFS transporter [Acidimicrobiia bacterium]|nr:MFS transporter [Acidimicrobiia bacterium]